ncbi:hypothetical protein QN277_017297 [Acacia crassicarpa]|uniref:Response regulatory domain-containing protein n=1 Tax=Acacia crassicarpa TaxID=499986 RepID=A0AAE1JTN3_9FABA|nr:hypothetical protein QN277_017297 [Acacia crassicarpa]
MAVESEVVVVGGRGEKEHFHVLAVDDSVIDRKLLERLLTVSSCKVTCVDSGDQALKYLGLLDDLHNTINASSPSLHSSHHEGTKVNMIMTDYCMPGMSGYDLLKRLKGSPWKDIPVVIMSSENVPSRISMCLEGGAEEFLLKPLQLSDLEKLQPYFPKFPDNSCEGESTSADEDNDQDNNHYNCNSISKRKATSAEPREKSRSKMKEYN